jgi:3-oxo-5alpha-steroid 4-dehydrogenase
MNGPEDAGRRRLFAAAAGAALAPAAAAAPRAGEGAWDVYVDVLVTGSGAAGLCAALEARAAGRSVLVAEALPDFGGASRRSPGILYAGGGSPLQRALGIDDSVDAMYDYLMAAGEAGQDQAALRRYCEGSAEHIAWLAQRGVDFGDRLGAAVEPLPAEGGLYYSGAETAPRYRALARPAPRGHVAAGPRGGATLVQALLGAARRVGVELRDSLAAQRLVAAPDGRVLGAVLDRAGQGLAVRARAGVVLACGGFAADDRLRAVHHRHRASVPLSWGGDSDRGRGIAMGIGAGAATAAMHCLGVLADIPVSGGIIINAAGRRIVAEDAAAGAVGSALLAQRGDCWVVADRRATPALEGGALQRAAEANSVGDLAAALGLPRGALQNSVAYYNRYAANGTDPLFQRAAPTLRPLQGPPYGAWLLRPGTGLNGACTLGGLLTDPEGRVLDGFGDPLPGLFAAGRNAACLLASPQAARGLALGSASFFGRSAGRAAAAG